MDRRHCVRINNVCLALLRAIILKGNGHCENKRISKSWLQSLNVISHGQLMC